MVDALQLFHCTFHAGTVLATELGALSFLFAPRFRGNPTWPSFPRSKHSNPSRLNVMTGLFSSSSIRAAERNHDVMMQNRTALREAAARLFEKMDMSGFGTITITEFEAVYEDENHVLTLDEFTEGCLLLRGNARSVDVFALKQQNKKIREQIAGLTKMHTELSEFLLERDTISARWPPVPHGRLEVIST